MSQNNKLFRRCCQGGGLLGKVVFTVGLFSSRRRTLFMEIMIHFPTMIGLKGSLAVLMRQSISLERYK